MRVLYAIWPKGDPLAEAGLRAIALWFGGTIPHGVIARTVIDHGDDPLGSFFARDYRRDSGGEE